jgi:hypothetical protein
MLDTELAHASNQQKQAERAERLSLIESDKAFRDLDVAAARCARMLPRVSLASSAA